MRRLTADSLPQRLFVDCRVIASDHTLFHKRQNFCGQRVERGIGGGKYGGLIFCRLEENLDCLCTYSESQYDEDFDIGDQVIVVITRYNYEKKQIYGKIIAKW